MATTGPEATKTDQTKVIKQLAAIICGAGNEKTAQRRAADEIEAIIRANPGIQLDSAIDPAFPSVTLASLSVSMKNIPALLALISLGATSIKLINNLPNELEGTTPAPTTAASAMTASQTPPQPENLTQVSRRVIGQIYDILKPVKTATEEQLAATKIDFLLMSQPIKVDFNMPIILVNSASGAPMTTYLLDMVFFKHPDTAVVLLKHGAEWTPNLIKIAEKQPECKAIMEDMKKSCMLSRNKLEEARRSSETQQQLDDNEKKSKRESEKANRIALMGKFRTESSPILSDAEKIAQEFLLVYRAYCLDLSFAVFGGVTSGEILQRNAKILWDTFETICEGCSIIKNCLTVKLGEDDDTIGIRWVHGVYNAHAKYQRTMESLRQKIDLLPTELKDKIQPLVNDSIRIVNGSWRRFNTILPVCSDGYSERFVNIVDESSYEMICRLEENKTYAELIAINQRYLTLLKAEIKNKIETIVTLFEPLRQIIKDAIAFDMYKRVYLDTIEHNFRKVMAVAGNDNEGLDSADKFIKYSLADRDIKSIYAKNFITVKNVVQAMLKFNSGVSITIEMLQRQGIQPQKASTAATEPLVSHEAILAQEREIAKMREAARREHAQALLRSKANYNAEQAKIAEAKKKIENEKLIAKNKIMAELPKLAKDELQLIEDILQDKNPNDSKDESRIKAIVKKLNLPNRKTTGSSGGLIITIHKTTVNFHHKHHPTKKVSGKLDDGFIADFRKALNEIGITFADLEATKAANEIAGDNIDATAVASTMAATAATAATAAAATASASATSSSVRGMVEKSKTKMRKK